MSYSEWLNDKLSDPERAAKFLNAAREDSPAMFFKAVRKVAQAQPDSMTHLAETIGISRESLYRIMSETGNPTYETFVKLLTAMGLTIRIEPLTGAAGGDNGQRDEA